MEARPLGTLPARIHPFQKILMGVSIRSAIFLSRNIVVVNFFLFLPIPPNQGRVARMWGDWEENHIHSRDLKEQSEFHLGVVLIHKYHGSHALSSLQSITTLGCAAGDESGPIVLLSPGL